MSLQPHQQRVVEEKDQLDGRLSHLDAFIVENPTFKTLPEAEQVRLTRQANVMHQYSDLLAERIDAFPKEPT